MIGTPRALCNEYHQADKAQAIEGFRQGLFVLHSPAVLVMRQK